ncbi:MAG: pyrimidine 5'-nucleotidase [Anaerolineales bacterium]
MTPIEQLFIDLDDTLYPAGNGLWNDVSARIGAYMVERIGLTPQEADERRLRYYRQFGTSLTGLMADYGIDPDEYLSFVHDIPLERYLSPDPKLIELLERLPQSKAIFTNASRSHAERVMDLLEVSRYFSRIIAIEDTGLVNKPELHAYTRALELTGRRDGEGSLFADDTRKNLPPAAGLGMITVWVNSRADSPAEGIHHCIPTILQLTEAVPELLNGKESEPHAH